MTTRSAGRSVPPNDRGAHRARDRQRRVSASGDVHGPSRLGADIRRLDRTALSSPGRRSPSGRGPGAESGGERRLTGVVRSAPVPKRDARGGESTDHRHIVASRRRSWWQTTTTNRRPAHTVRAGRHEVYRDNSPALFPIGRPSRTGVRGTGARWRRCLRVSRSCSPRVLPHGRQHRVSARREPLDRQSGGLCEQTASKARGTVLLVYRGGTHRLRAPGFLCVPA